MITLPEKPWAEGADFTVEETGVRYVYDGEKWLSESGEEADLSGFATKVQLNEVDRTAIMRDDALEKTHDEDHVKQAAINAGVVVSLDELFWRDVELGDAVDAGAKELQAQIDELKDPSSASAVGTLRWQDYSWDNGNVDSLNGVARFHPDRSKMSLNHDTIDSGRVDWPKAFGDEFPVEIGVEVEGNTYRAVINSTGSAGTNDRGKNFEIVESDLPDNVTRDAEVTFYDNYIAPTIELEDLDERFVNVKGGDIMEGPLAVRAHSGDSRGTSRIKTLGVFTENNSALRLGTTTDRIYVEDDNTKFNGGVLVDKLGPKNDGRGVTLLEEGTADGHLVTKGYVDSKASTNQTSGSLASWKGRLIFVTNGSEGHYFYFTDVNGVPTNLSNRMKEFHWALPNGHWLGNCDGAGRDIGSINIYDANHALKWSSQAITTSSGSSVVIDCNREDQFYWGRDLVENTTYIVEIISCFREK